MLLAELKDCKARSTIASSIKLLSKYFENHSYVTFMEQSRSVDNIGIDIANVADYFLSNTKHTDTMEDNVDTTPDVESFNGYGFNNYTAAEAFIQGLSGMVNQGDVETMIRAQKQM